MTTPGKTAAAPKLQGTKLEWLNLPRRRCDNCGKRYKPKRPNSKYCTSECQQAFNRHGGAYQKLKDTIGKEIKKQMGVTQKCARCKGTGRRRGQKHGLPCDSPTCRNGRQLTDYGRELVRELRPYFETPSAAGAAAA